MPLLTEATREPRWIGLLRERREKAVLPFEDFGRAGKAFACESRGERAALGGPAEMQALHHAARMRELEQP